MAIEEQSIIIKAPIDKIYEWVHYSPNLVEVWPNLVNSTFYERDEEGLGTHKVTYMMVGFRIPTQSIDLSHIPNRQIVTESTAGIKSILTWNFEEVPEGTLVNFSAEYNLPLPLIGKLAESIVIAMNKNDAIAMLSNLRSRMEELFGK